MYRLLVAFLCVIFFVASTRAEDPHYRVKLQISASDNIRGEVTSYLSRQLRQIGDIDIVDDDPWIIISVIALQTSNKGGVATGYAFAVLVERPVRYRQIRDNYQFAAKFDETRLTVMDFAFDHTTTVLSHFIQVDNEVESMCRKIVASIDGDIFENQRKVTRQLVDKIQKDQSTPTK